TSSPTAALFPYTTLFRSVVSADGSLDADRIVDLVLNPNPAMPWCWMVIALERDDEGLGEGLVARRGTMTLLPRLTPAAACASARSEEHTSELQSREKLVC